MSWADNYTSELHAARQDEYSAGRLAESRAMRPTPDPRLSSWKENGDPIETCPNCGENRIDQLMNTDGAGHQFTCWTCDHVYYI
jgi:hypothetical protein